jgi:hypothetical protein
MRRLILLAVLVALAGSSSAELGYTTVSANSTAQTVTVASTNLVVVNDGTNEIYVRVFWEGETVAAATTSSAQIKSGETFAFTKDFNLIGISIVCAAAETATVRLYY